MEKDVLDQNQGRVSPRFYNIFFHINLSRNKLYIVSKDLSRSRTDVKKYKELLQLRRLRGLSSDYVNFFRFFRRFTVNSTVFLLVSNNNGGYWNKMIATGPDQTEVVNMSSSVWQVSRGPYGVWLSFTNYTFM